MALREHSRPVPAGRSGRHGRPGPFGGRLRLPTIRFSGAAMAMSTVVGISLATTWLLNEQQQVGRRIGVTVGGPPVPSPDATPAESPAPAPGSTLQAAPATAGGAPATPTGRPSDRPGTGTGTASPTAATASAPPLRLAEDAAATATPSPAASSPSSTPAPAGSPSPSATRPAPLAPAPSASSSPSPSAKPTPSAPAALPGTLHGTARVDALGPTGTRHTLRLDLDEAMTALQVEFRLNRPAALPGSTPATDLPGAVVTVALERDTLVYRFTTPADLPLRPGSYTFTMTGATAQPGAAPAAPETWTASAFALPTSRALAARGTF
ncbi:hypothetical protein OU787_24155 [Kitasatospora sp. YST-16]|uniref:hypothetical protein n=1 Tax=unclassified Kitasatospora TaxID=2633591 RepID=UPI0004C39946|nr:MULTISPECIES: hypothetical protein [unclassified Kitasatospora]WAL74316.1 hypothetical protein OU787_24155 [Kitasatospora sp. YST-16]WNW40383.1 hypothetical protein RKE32_24115 [Streptomyces sp. Li-HN-5-13]